MGLPGMVFSAIAIAVGAVMYWAITTTQGHGFRLSTVGVILMVIGGIGFVTSAVVFAVSRRPATIVQRTYPVGTTSEAPATVVHEQVR